MLKTIQSKWTIYSLVLSSLFFTVHARAEIYVYAASSLTNVVSDIVTQYKQVSSTNVIPVFASSSSLARQIESGAPVDIFISANQNWMDYLAEKKRVNQHNRVNLVKNQLVLIHSSHKNIAPFDLYDANAWKKVLTTEERLAVGNTDAVPAGMYAKQTLSSLGVWEVIKKQLAPMSTVRLALALVERGEAPLGIVYKTDALISKDVAIVSTFDDHLHEPIEYPMAWFNKKEETIAFRQFLRSPQALALFEQYGFSSIPATSPVDVGQ